MRVSLEQKPPSGLGIDWSHPLARDLGAVWLLNEGAGTLANDLLGRVPAVPDDRMWFGGAGLRCSGSNYASFAHDPRTFVGDQVSVFASIVPTAFGATHDELAVFTKGSSPHTLYFTAGGGKVNVYSEANGSWLDGSAAIPLNGRSVVGFTKDSGGRKLWLNGRLDASDGVTGALNWGSAGGRIGHRQDNANPTSQFTGVIEWVAVWGRGLTAGEVRLVQHGFAGSIVIPMRLGGSLALQTGGPLFRRTEFERAGVRSIGPG